MSVFQNRTSVHGKCFQGRKGKVCDHPNQNQSGSYSEHPSSTHSKGMQKLFGVVNYLSLFCQNLQKLLAPIYDLTRKGRPFIWTESHQKTFDTIKQQLAKAPVLSLPDCIGRYTLYSDTSKTHAGSALWQMQKVETD